MNWLYVGGSYALALLTMAGEVLLLLRRRLQRHGPSVSAGFTPARRPQVAPE